VLVLTVSVDANPWPDVLVTAEGVLLLVLAGLYTFFGVSGFLEEKRSGALELLLVTPLSVNDLIFGRVWGLWKQFFPAALVLACCYACIAWAENSRGYGHEDVKQPIFLISCIYLALPIFATYFALRVKNLFVAAMLTWIALCLPVLLVSGMFVNPYEYGSGSFFAAFFFGYVALSFVACFLLRHSLSRRIYSF
jgi:ABC-type Na+ efflux pump permease subunit